MALKARSRHLYAADGEFLGATSSVAQAIERGLPHSSLLKPKQSLGLNPPCEADPCSHFAFY